MKEIRAYIKPHRLSQVNEALHKVKGLTGMSVSNVRGFGRGKSEGGKEAVTEETLDFIPKVKIEIVCQDELVDEIISAIEHAARTGLRGGRKIYVANVNAAIRISTGERGARAS